MSTELADRIADRITEYLALGGAFNPEATEHDKVRDLLIDCRAALASPAPVAGEAGTVDRLMRRLEDAVDLHADQPLNIDRMSLTRHWREILEAALSAPHAGQTK